MKNVLIASTALLLTGGAALADVTISGNGRFGLLYQETDVSGDTETTINLRLRFNIDASKETDSGVKFGGRIRLQYDSGDSFAFSDINGTTGEAGAELSAAKLYASYGGMRLEAGNVDTAYDSAALMYNSEMGYLDRAGADPQGSYYSFSSGPYDASEANRMGLAFTYSVGDFNGRISWVNGDQTNVTQNLIDDAGLVVFPDTFNDEYGISLDYKFGQFTVSAAAVKDGLGIKDNDNYFVGGEFAINDVANVGLQYFDNGDTNGDLAGDRGKQISLYGNYKFDAITVKAFVANNDADGNKDDTVYGLGADYDLGGATLSGSVQSQYDGNATADLGVRFSF